MTAGEPGRRPGPQSDKKGESMFTRRSWSASLLALALAACGGGGGDAGSSPSEAPVGPPATAASLAASTGDAIEVAKSAVSGADGVVSRYTALSGFSALMGVPIAGSQAVPMAAVRAAARLQRPADGRQVALDVRAVSCLDVVDGPCTGTATMDTNIPQTATSVSAGQYVEVNFSNISGYSMGYALTLNGRLRIEFLTSVNLNQATLANVGLRLQFVALGGSFAGVSYGPLTELMDLTLDASGEASLVSSGARYGVMDAISITGAGSYAIGTGNVRAAFGSSNGYADVALSNWRSSASRPAVGSQATLTAGSGRATVAVSSSSTGTVVYAVAITLGGTTTRYTVTATYSGNTPSYSASLLVPS